MSDRSRWGHSSCPLISVLCERPIKARPRWSYPGLSSVLATGQSEATVVVTWSLIRMSDRSRWGHCGRTLVSHPCERPAKVRSLIPVTDRSGRGHSGRILVSVRSANDRSERGHSGCKMGLSPVLATDDGVTCYSCYWSCLCKFYNFIVPLSQRAHHHVVGMLGFVSFDVNQPSLPNSFLFCSWRLVLSVQHFQLYFIP